MTTPPSPPVRGEVVYGQSRGVLLVMVRGIDDAAHSRFANECMMSAQYVSTFFYDEGAKLTSYS
ncbi:MAG: hypothetical protein ACRC9V_12700 [Aeromonas sp.]